MVPVPFFPYACTDGTEEECYAYIYLCASVQMCFREVMKNSADRAADIVLAVDAMGTDHGPRSVVEGLEAAVSGGLRARCIFFGDRSVLHPLIQGCPLLAGAEICHTPHAVGMSDKPMHVLRRGRDTSMWKAVLAVKEGRAHAVLSGGNTGALMAVAKTRLDMIDGIDRPALAALWPTRNGRSVVLDVGSTVDAGENQLVQFAIMGEAFFRALTGRTRPSVALLNVGSEEGKGHEAVRAAGRMLRAAGDAMNFTGFVEGDGISEGRVDVVVTDGFSGNIALKSAEGAARLVGHWLREAVNGGPFAKLGALLLRSGLHRLKTRMDPSSFNGGVFLGLKGIVVKSHGGADARGICSAAHIAASLAGHSFGAGVERAVRSLPAWHDKNGKNDDDRGNGNGESHPVMAVQ